jgi:hypothetical protein
MTLQSEIITVDNRRLPVPSNQFESGERRITATGIYEMTVGEFSLRVEHPANVKLPEDIIRLLKGLSRKLEHLALQAAR